VNPSGDDEPLRGLRAAQYVRMSTYQQKYSIENQAAAIAAYASERKIDIVKQSISRGTNGGRSQELGRSQDARHLVRPRLETSVISTIGCYGTKSTPLDNVT